ncbi:MAG: hypothetical protein LBH22_02765 [Bacteroidales bacterium]|jgi:polyhydroxyalkanoate synthesis regulator protein|nr:hypothetical protein [Bacteroidales bacterium]
MGRQGESKNRDQRLKKIAQLVKRLEEFTNFKGESINELTKALQISASYFSASKRGEGIIGADVVIMILEHYRDLSPDWLLFGTGSRLRGGVEQENKVTAISSKKSKLEEELKKSVEKTKKMKAVFQRLVTSTEKSLEELAELHSKVKF